MASAVEIDSQREEAGDDGELEDQSGLDQVPTNSLLTFRETGV